MAIFYILISALSFLLHLALETLASFVKYNFSSLGMHMTGVSYSNILATASRGCVAIFGVTVAVLAEKKMSNINVYTIVFSTVMILGATFSLYLSKFKVDRSSILIARGGLIAIARNLRLILVDNNHVLPSRLNNYVAILLGTQFASVIVAYGLCFLLPDQRLFIVSSVPLISMLGTVVTFIFVEPMFAKIIDSNNAMGYAVSKELLRARALSFLLCSALLPSLSLVVTALRQ